MSGKVPFHRELCESAKRGNVCIDDLCRWSDVTLCGFDKDLWDEIQRDSEPDEWRDDDYEEVEP